MAEEICGGGGGFSTEPQGYIEVEVRGTRIERRRVSSWHNNQRTHYSEDIIDTSCPHIIKALKELGWSKRKGGIHVTI